MIAPGLRHCAVLALAAAAWCAAAAAPVHAADASASAWVGDARSALRLVAGTPGSDQGFLPAGVEIRLAPGWKTYWRYPGDSGVGPRFDFTGSTNIRSATVAWPMPHAFRDAGGLSIGYKEKVLFPVRIVAQEPGRPVVLALAFEYAICERVCIPQSGRVALSLPATTPDQDAALAMAAARVPVASAVGAGAGLAIRAVERVGDWPRPRILVDVAAPAGEAVELFAEGPTAEWALPVPEPAGIAAGGIHRFGFVLDGVPPGVDPKGAMLTLTATAGAHAIEAQYRLD